MKSFLLAAALASRAAAGTVEGPVRAAPAALAGASSVGAASISFDGAGPLKPWVEIAGTPLVRIGRMVIDTRVSGSAELLKSVTFADNRPVLGIFEIRTARVVNAYAVGTAGVRGHSDAVPQGRDRSELGGYTLFLRPDGSTLFMGSGSLPAEVTPAVRRAVLRHLGARPAVMSLRERFKRLWLSVLDWAMGLGRQ